MCISVINRSENAGSILLYTLKEHGWRKGEPMLVNDITIRIENANGSQHDLSPIADKIVSALTPITLYEALRDYAMFGKFVAHHTEEMDRDDMFHFTIDWTMGAYSESFIAFVKEEMGE